jgi:hypothetical protein
MLFRGRQPEATIWRRFRVSPDGFTFLREDEHFVAHVVANAERVVDLFYALTEQLSPAVDVVIEDLRSGRMWRGERLALPDVRDSVARLKILLARYGGVEVTIFTSEDQLSLTPGLELFVYATTDRWLYLLEGKGLEERPTVRSKSWRVRRQHFPAAPELVTAVASATERLGLRLA